MPNSAVAPHFLPDWEESSFEAEVSACQTCSSDDSRVPAFSYLLLIISKYLALVCDFIELETPDGLTLNFGIDYYASLESDPNSSIGLLG